MTDGLCYEMECWGIDNMDVLCLLGIFKKEGGMLAYGCWFQDREREGGYIEKDRERERERDIDVYIYRERKRERDTGIYKER